MSQQQFAEQIGADAVCRYCTHLDHTDPGTPSGRAWEPLEWVCAHKLPMQPGRHSCEQFEREPGVDDDLERKG